MVNEGRPRGTGIAAVALMMAAAIGLSGCGSGTSAGLDPIDWYRNLSGASANDPKDKGANSTNLAEGAKEPYPNLASVPKEPDTAISEAERKRLAQSLIADRQNAQYTDQQLRAGQPMNGIVPPPPPVAAAMVPAPRQTAAATPPMPRTERPPGRPVAAPRGPVHQETLPTAAPPPQTAQAAPMAAPPKPAAPSKKAANKTKKKVVQEKRGAEAPPQESSLRPPSIDNLPRGEQAEAAPPPPPGTPTAARRARPARHEEEVAAAAPSAADVTAPRPQAVSGHAAEINFAPAPFRARILPSGQKRLAEIARMAEQQNVRIRVVGYGAGPPGADKQQREFQSFNAALDNAKAVGIELAKLGVAADRIDIETSTNVNASDHAEVFVEY